MQLNEYQTEAMKMLNPGLNQKEVLVNALMGLCGESGEAIDILKKHLFQGHDLDRAKIIKELGDVAWYLAEAATGLGVTLESPAVNLQGVAAEQAPTETDASGEFIPVTVTGAQRLSTALQILKALESNDIVGDAASVDVTRTEGIVLWYGTRYQVNLGDSSRLDYKIACMNDVILQMSDYQSGILDISFTHWPTKVGYTPFS